MYICIQETILLKRTSRSYWSAFLKNSHLLSSCHESSTYKYLYIAKLRAIKNNNFFYVINVLL